MMALTPQHSPNKPKPRFAVKKNTLPYIHQWAVIDRKTGFKMGEYQTRELAEEARDVFCSQNTGLVCPEYRYTEAGIESAREALEKRMKQPEGDPPPKPPRHSNKRRIELSDD